MALTYNKNNMESFLVMLIHSNELLRNAFLEKFSHLNADIESFKSNYHCGCRKKIELFIRKNRDIVSDFFDNFYNSNPSMQDDLDGAIKNYSGFKVSGLIFEIDDTQEAYSAFYERMIEEKFAFDSMQIARADNKLRIYFL